MVPKFSVFTWNNPRCSRPTNRQTSCIVLYSTEGFGVSATQDILGPILFINTVEPRYFELG